MGVFEYKAHIRYQDINEYNQLSDKGILNILSEAAGAHSEVVGYSLNDIEKTGYSWMLLYWKIKVYKRPCWNEAIIIKTWARNFEKVSSWRDFEVYDKNGEIITIGTTQWVLIDAKKQKVAKITEDMANEYGLVQKSVFKEELTGKLVPEEYIEKVYEYTARRRDIDANHHVNNIIYLEMAYDAFPQELSIDFQNLEIYYKKQIKLGEKVSIYYSGKNNVHTVCIKSIDGKDLHAVLKFF